MTPKINLIKAEASKFENTGLLNYDIVRNVADRIFNDLNNKLDNVIIEALRHKGFEFEHRIKLEYFIKERCRCEDNIDLKERVYYVDNVPFFLHNYKRAT